MERYLNAGIFGPRQRARYWTTCDGSGQFRRQGKAAAAVMSGSTDWRALHQGADEFECAELAPVSTVHANNLRPQGPDG